MTFVFDDSEPENVPLTIKSRGSEFTLLLKPPTLERLIDDDILLLEANASEGFSRALAARTSRRIDCIVAWNGIVDPKGNPVPFSREMLLKLIAKMPSILNDLGPALTKLFYGEDIAAPTGDAVATPVGGTVAAV